MSDAAAGGPGAPAAPGSGTAPGTDVAPGSATAPATPPAPGTAAPAAPLRVLVIPDYGAHNPYQRLLADALARHGVTAIGGRPGRRRPLPILAAWRRAGRPPVIHLHWTHEYLKGRGTGPSRLSRLRLALQLDWLRRRGVRVVWTIHNIAGHDRPRDPAEMSAQRDTLRRVDAAIAHCAAARAAAIGAWGLTPAEAERIAVVPHGSYAGVHPPGPGRAAARARLGLPAAGPVLLFLGVVRPYKGIEALVGALAALPDPDLRLVIAGEQKDAALGTALAAAAAADPRIVLRPGYVPDGDVGLLMDAADVVALPFRDILTSGSAILALTFGRPVVAPARGCLPETIPPAAGVLYDPDAPGALAAAIAEALAGDRAAQEAAARAAADGLAWDPIAARTAALYRG